jgi:tetratricopeptide (TPR) repeat protein
MQSPSSLALQSQYQQTATTLQSTFDRIGRSSKALGVSLQWIAFAQKLKEANPSDGSAMLFLINAYHQYGHLLEKYSRRDEALDAYQNALDVCTQASERSLVSAQLLYQQVELQMHRFHLLLPTSSPQQTKDNFLTALHTALRLGLFTKSDSPERVAARSQLHRGLDALVQAGLAQEAQELRAQIKEFEDLP